MKAKTKNNKHIKFYFLGVILAYFALYNPVFAFVDTFETYNTGDLSGQTTPYTAPTVDISEVQSVSPTKSAYFNTFSDVLPLTQNFTTNDNIFTFKYFSNVMFDGINSYDLDLELRLVDVNGQHTTFLHNCIPAESNDVGYLRLTTVSNCSYGGILMDTPIYEQQWYNITIELNFFDDTFRAKIDDGEWSSFVSFGSVYNMEYISYFRFGVGGQNNASYYLDDINLGENIETCSDGIQNQDETGVDVGGVCFYVALNWPENLTQVPDFLQWTTTYYGNDAPTSPTLQMGVHWSDDIDILDTCLNFPTSPADYATCFGTTPHLNIDYGTPVWSSFSELREDIEKTGTMQAGQTYYARAVLWSTTGTENTRDILLSYSDIISFNIDNTGGASACPVGDIPCYIRTAIQWAFIPDAETLTQFSDFKGLLESKAPFGYVKQIYDALTTITYDAESDVVVLEQVSPINDLIFTPIRTALVWLLYFVFMFMLFKRFRDIQI